ncbi:MAG: 3-phosphoshikimate 1-carboxyvinyltransferase [Saprospiraceae bacterium]|nr:3-phosphoshikimate 1-carboxyvinyltransferase [Saprospiraceae bacterium]
MTNNGLKSLRLGRTLRATVTLDGSKSISNRALIALALAGETPEKWLSGLSTSKDTVTLQKLLQNPENPVFDAGDAGTVFRFLTAYLSTRPGVKTLTGSTRMLERPVGPLVEALQSLGADIRFLGRDGYPPLQIGEMQPQGRTVRVAANVSSQFLSALLLIGPYLPDGLEVIPEGPLVSRPYLDMTLGVMRHFGAQAEWQGNAVAVKPGIYHPQPLSIEADWSAASYWYALAAFSDELDLTLRGLHRDSWQGDSVLPRMMEQFGIQTTFGEQEIRLQKSGKPARPLFQWDFLECPDIAQTLAVVCAGLGVTGLFSGLETLSIKETDRISAIKTELAKVGVSFVKLPPHFSKKQPDKTFYSLEGQASWANTVRFATYGDHRMAMAFAALGMLGPVEIENPDVVAKSYPNFWQDLRLTAYGGRRTAVAPKP